MGMLVNGEWTTKNPGGRYREGRFQRPTTQIRDFVTADGSSAFEAEPGRYHLYISHACPWAHRTVIFRRLKRLDEVISLSVGPAPCRAIFTAHPASIAAFCETELFPPARYTRGREAPI